MTGLKKPLLLAEDGAVFIGHVQVTDDGRFQASCHAMLDHRSHVEEEEPHYEIRATEEEAKEWLHQQAGMRGFKTIRMMDD